MEEVATLFVFSPQPTSLYEFFPKEPLNSSRNPVTS